MGCVENIAWNKFPKQKGDDYKYPKDAVGRNVKVCFQYDTSHMFNGKVVRHDMEDPGIMIIALEDGRYVLDTECQYRTIE